MIELRGKWLLVDGLASAIIGGLFGTLLLGYGARPPLSEILFVAFCLATTCYLGLIAAMLWRGLQRRHRSGTEASTSPE